LIFDIYQLLFLPLMVKIANKIIVSSFDYIQNSRLKKYLQKYPDKFVEIPLGVDTHKFYPQEKDLTLIKKYNLGSEDRIILFVGGLDKAHYFKGVDKLLQAVAVLRLKIPDLRLLIIGEGDLRSSYEKLAQDLGIGANVIFAGRVSDEDLSEHYNLADFVVLPSIDKSESLGLVLLEAMACAKPIIVSNLPGPRTLVQKNINGLLVEPGKIKDLAEKIKFLLENKELIKKWGINGRHLVEERYNLFLIIQALDKLYKKL
jgi:glycosyltransferase involved in cell wall biosynthesis